MYSKYIDISVKDLKNKGYNVLYLAAFGSYNYGLQTKNSDFDMKAIIETNESELFKNPKPHSFVKYQFGDCEVLSVYEFGEKLSNFELPYLEILFSDINYVNPNFKHEELKSFVNDVLLKNRTFLGNEIIRIMEKINKSFAKNIFDFRGKKTYNIIRLYHLFVKFNSTKKYENCLFVVDDRDLMIRHKSGNITKDEASEDCDNYICKMKLYMKHHDYVESEQLRSRIYNQVSKLVDDMKKQKILIENEKNIQDKLSFSKSINFHNDKIYAEIDTETIIRNELETELVDTIRGETKELKTFIMLFHGVELSGFVYLMLFVVICMIHN